MPKADGSLIQQGHDGKFLPGNKLGKGYPQGRAVQLLRLRALKFFRGDPLKLDRLLDTLEQMAFDERQDGAVRVAAIKELLSRALGKSDQTVNVQGEVGTAPRQLSQAEHLAMYLKCKVPWDDIPLSVRGQSPRPVVATVIEQAPPNG